jgi:hypothetical protein
LKLKKKLKNPKKVLALQNPNTKRRRRSLKMQKLRLMGKERLMMRHQPLKPEARNFLVNQ